MQQKQGYRATRKELSYDKKRTTTQQKQGYRTMKKELLYNEKSKKEGQCPRGNCPFAL